MQGVSSRGNGFYLDGSMYVSHPGGYALIKPSGKAGLPRPARGRGFHACVSTGQHEDISDLMRSADGATG